MKIAISLPGCHRRGGVECVTREGANLLATGGHETHALASDWDVPSLHAGAIRHHVPVLRLPSAWRSTLFARASRARIRALQQSADVVASLGVSAPSRNVLWMQNVHAAWRRALASAEARLHSWRFLRHATHWR